VALRAHDPGGIATRRAIRAAVALPLTIVIVLYPLANRAGAIFAVLGVVGLLINADFAGTVRSRILAYAATGVAGTAAVLLGWAVSLTLVSAVVVTMVVAFALTLLSIFRGSVSSGTAAVLLLYVLAVCVGGPSSSLPANLLGWWIAVVVSTLTAVLLLPRTTRPSVRPLMAQAYAAAAGAARSAWGAESDDAAVARHVRDFDTAVDGMETHLADQPFRTQGLSEREGIISILSNLLSSVRLLVDEVSRVTPFTTSVPFPARAQLADATVDALGSLSRAMDDPSLIISAKAVDEARRSMNDGVDTWVMTMTQQGMAAEDISRDVAAHHRMRIFALLTEQMVEMARVANGGDVEELDARPPVPKRSARRMLSAQLTLQSPWMRNAIRSGVGLGLGVLVMSLTGVDRGFWVLLAVIAVLRFDAIGTRRYALLAIVGTGLGVVAGLGLIALVGGHPLGLWILLPLLTFVAAWAGSAVNFPSGQAAFTAMVLVALGIVNWPPDPALGLVRLQDIALGAGVAFVVGLLLWPRGAAAYLRTRLAASFRASSDHLEHALASFTDDDELSRLPALRSVALGEIYRTGETFDVATAQPGTAHQVREWIPALNLAVLVETVARLVGDFAGRYPITDAAPSLRQPLDAARQRSTVMWKALADHIDPNVPDAAALPGGPRLALPTLTPIRSIDAARQLVIAVWVVDWIQHLVDVVPDVLPTSDSPQRTAATPVAPTAAT
jgi:uncharacterized membrane protein YccC